MKGVTRHYFGIIFKLQFLEAQGDEFQKFFGQIMNLRYPGDFTQTRPWGKLGDNKSDGFLPSRKKFYQCYAPNELEKAATTKKLNEDFTGALPFSGKYFNTWVFVHNSRDGRLPAWLALEVDGLRQLWPEISIETLGLSELQEEALKLSDDQLVDLFGPLLTSEDVLAVQFQDIRPILEHVAKSHTPDDTPTLPVSSKKLQYNQLSQDVREYLRHGMIKAKLVEKYLDQNIDKQLAMRVADAFHQKYETLKKENSEPDIIFYGLRTFAQGQFSQTPKTEGAVLAVLSYLFEECDIFENAPDGFDE